MVLVTCDALNGDTCTRGRPFGDAAWVQGTAKRLGLTHTMRDRGRPKKDAGRASDRGRQ